MLDHIGFPVSDLKRSVSFYTAAFAPLGITLVMQVTREMTGGYEGAGFGSGGKPYFWVGAGRALNGSVHVAFAAADRKSVDAFYAAAIKAGGMDNGPPGIRAHYHSDYYAAFVLDPDGHNIEVVCHKPS
jgi:catechol 2,3-dioxygenase-like lactoylglutathione lyase family enzyme